MFLHKTAKQNIVHGPQYLFKRISQGSQLDLSIGENKQINDNILTPISYVDKLMQYFSFRKFQVFSLCS